MKQVCKKNNRGAKIRGNAGEVWYSLFELLLWLLYPVIDDLKSLTKKVDKTNKQENKDSWAFRTQALSGQPAFSYAMWSVHRA